MVKSLAAKKIQSNAHQRGEKNKTNNNLIKINKTFNKRKNCALLTLRRSQKHYEIFGNNVLPKNITQKQLRLETTEIA